MWISHSVRERLSQAADCRLLAIAELPGLCIVILCLDLEIEDGECKMCSHCHEAQGTGARDPKAAYLFWHAETQFAMQRTRQGGLSIMSQKLRAQPGPGSQELSRSREDSDSPSTTCMRNRQTQTHLHSIVSADTSKGA